MTAELRDHFVYRLFDNRGQLLYIGCSSRLDQRWQQHRHDHPAAVLATARCKVQGPFTKTKARQIEAKAIRSERSLFNGERYGGLPQREQTRRNVIAAHHLCPTRYLPPICPARDILIEAGLIEAAS